MCSNYESVTRGARLLSFFGVLHPDASPHVVFPLGLAPFVRLSELGRREALEGQFGLLPRFVKETSYGRRTYNARSETVATLPSFRDAWRRGQRCIVPAEAIFEPNYETGRAVRWRIQRIGAVPMGIAGVWTAWTSPEGRQAFSFAMLTVNAEGHPVFSRFHRPGDEKRMVIILDEDHYDDWLTCSTEDAPRYFRQWMGPLEASPAPLPPRDKGPVVGLF